MTVTRRNLMLAAGAMALNRAATAAEATAAATSPGAGQPHAATAPTLPDKTSFQTSGLTYLDSGSQHPMSAGARAAVNTYLAKRALDPAAAGYSLPDAGVRAKFARLINAQPDEIAYVQSTTSGEQAVLRGLGLPAPGSHIVTDTLHFFGSVPLYLEMARQGAEVTWVRARDGRIALPDLDKAIRKDTRLVALSLVSTINGFQHDLASVCELAHSRGALVYADIIHAAGSVPLDVKATGVDFAACATYKWLMGEFGLGFLYARKDLQARLRRTEFGYYGLKDFTSHIYPLDPPGDAIAEYSYEASAEGRFAHATHAHTVVAQLDHSLDYLQALGVPVIQAHTQKLVQHLKEELPKLGHVLMTPPEAQTPIVACAYANARERLTERMTAGRIRITLAANRFRITPSVFNDHDDIERFLAVLGRA